MMIICVLVPNQFPFFFHSCIGCLELRSIDRSNPITDFLAFFDHIWKINLNFGNFSRIKLAIFLRTRTTVIENRWKHSNFLGWEMQFIFKSDYLIISTKDPNFFRCIELFTRFPMIQYSKTTKSKPTQYTHGKS
jgi:hypothetical protein